MALEPVKPRVLVVDDCEDTRVIFQHLLESVGAEVCTAADGRDGVEQAITAMSEGRPFQLVLMDWRLPEFGGGEAIQLLRDRGYSGFIAACSAGAIPEQRGEIGSRIDLFIEKQGINRTLMASLLAKVCG